MISTIQFQLISYTAMTKTVRYNRWEIIVHTYLRREPNPEDGRSQLLFATPQAEGLRNAKAETESAFYDYLMDGLSESDRETFLNLLDVVYRRSKAESRAGFPHLKDVLKGKTNEPKT